MKLADIRVGEYYAVHLSDDTKYEGKPGRYSSLPGSFRLGGFTKVKVLAVGVSYGKGNQGVRIEYNYNYPRPCTCVSCGFEHWMMDETETRTNIITVHYSILGEQWDLHNLSKLDNEIRDFLNN